MHQSRFFRPSVLKVPPSLLSTALMLFSFAPVSLAAEHDSDQANGTNQSLVTAKTAALPRGASNIWAVSSPRALVIAVHGTTQQSGCFGTLARHLNDACFTLVGMDLRGHGQWLHSGESSSVRQIVDYRKSAQDLAELAGDLRKSYPGVPLFCIGESVGSGVVALAASKNFEICDGIVLVSPGSIPHVFSPAMVVKDFVVGIVNLQKQLDVSKYITRYSSEDPRITNEMITDKLSRTTLTAKEILQTAAFIRKIPRSASRLPPKLPVLVLQGAQDKIVTTSSVKSMMSKIAVSDKRMVVFSDSGHILLGTAFLKPAVISQLTEWLSLKCESIYPPVANLRASNKSETDTESLSKQSGLGLSCDSMVADKSRGVQQP